jgi:integrase
MSTADSTGKRVVVWVQLFPDRPHLMLQWHDPVTGKRKSRTAGTCNPLDAEKKRADLEYELNHGLYLEPSRMTWERFRELFEAEYLSGLRPNTRRNSGAAMDAFEQVCAPKLLRSIDVRTMSAFVTGLRQRPVRGRVGLAASTIAVYLESLHVALAWAVRQRMLPEVPAFPRVRVPKKDPQPVPPESFEKLVAGAPDADMRAYLLTGWLAGLRLTEAFLLEWEPTTAAPWVDLANDRIVLPAELVKGVRDQWVPLDARLREVLLALPRRGKRVFQLSASAHAACQRVRWLAKRVGVPLTFRALRRGFGCRFAARVPAQVLQKLMRHRRIQTTLDYYVNVDDAAREAVREASRNSSRNTGPEAADKPAPGGDATPWPGPPSAPA